MRIDCPHGYLRLSAEVESLVFRLFQQALANIAKYAEASAIDIAVRLDSWPIMLTISDNGQCSCPHPAAGGLSLHELAELAGGMLDLQFVAGQGTRIEFTRPGPVGKE